MENAGVEDGTCQRLAENLRVLASTDERAADVAVVEDSSRALTEDGVDVNAVAGEISASQVAADNVHEGTAGEATKCADCEDASVCSPKDWGLGSRLLDCANADDADPQ